MSQNNVSKIKERLGIKEVVESYIKLEKAGNNYKARCPFHNEKTPSFFVSPERESYYCFGCGAKGDIFTFVQEFEGVDFVGALKILADKAGIKIDSKNYKQDHKSILLKQIQEEATVFFEGCFKKNSEVLIYLKKRGLTEKTIKDWRIGFAPSGWKNLRDYLHFKNFRDEDIEAAGLIKRGNRDECYDRFRSRIMFPISNSAGEIIAFSGRIFGSEEDVAKYINSPETEIFKKSNILYGFDRAKGPIRKNNFSILVEGQMDTIMCHQAGYKNVVASSGTSITEGQLRNLNKITSNIVIAYDSDNAGFTASTRAWRMALSIGMDVKIAPIKEGFDPADLIKDDLKQWKETIKSSKHIVDVLIEKIKITESDKRTISKRVVAEIIPFLSSISGDVDRHHFIKKVSENFDIPVEIINSEIVNYNKNSNDENFNSDDNSYPKANLMREKDELYLEKRLFGVMYYFESKKPDVFKKIQKGIINIVGQEEYDRILESINNELEEIIFAVENSFDEKTLKKESTELIKNLQIKKLNKDRKKMLVNLKEAEGGDDESVQNDLLKKINEISKQIQDLNG